MVWSANVSLDRKHLWILAHWSNLSKDLGWKIHPLSCYKWWPWSTSMAGAKYSFDADDRRQNLKGTSCDNKNVMIISNVIRCKLCIYTYVIQIKNDGSDTCKRRLIWTWWHVFISIHAVCWRAIFKQPTMACNDRITIRYTVQGNYHICIHYSDVIIGTMASQITSLAIVYSSVYSGADQRKRQSSASLTFVRGIHRWPVNYPHKWPVTRKMFPFDGVIILYASIVMGMSHVRKTNVEKLHNWSLRMGMDMLFHPTLYNGCNNYPCWSSN